jgi:phosphate transport system substrate-binding protein
MRNWRMLTALLVALGLLAAACGGESDALMGAPGDAAGDAADDAGGDDAEERGADEPAGRGLAGELTGAGATFPAPLYQDWTFVYQNEVQPGVTINYQSIGSGGGIEQFLSDTVDWGTSERYLRDDALADAVANRDCDAIQIPIVYGSVVIAFNDPEFDGMVLDAEAISDIFRREITNFSDPYLAELNPDMDLPDLDIIPVHRSDGSGTTSVFTTWLEDEVPAWAEELGSGTEVQWPAGTVGGQGNEGVTAGIVQNPGGLGYVNQAYALENDLPQAQVVNADGNAVYPTLEATTEAIEGLDIPDTFQFDILGVGGDGYPITGTVWNFYYTCGYDESTEAMLKDFWIWATQSQEADQIALELGYAPLGASLKARVLATLERINEEGP